MKQLYPMFKLRELIKFLGIVILVITLAVAFILQYRRKGIKSTHSDADIGNNYLLLDEGGLAVTFLDAGKADAIVIYTNHSTVLIDTGLKSEGKELVQFLQDREIDTIDYLILTHFDKDHVGGAAKVIENLKVNNIITSDYLKDSEEVENYLEACEKAQIQPEILKETISFTLDNVRYTVYPHIASSYPEQESNNSSLIISVEHGENRILITGDANNLRIKEFLIDQEKNFDYQLLKVPYHGRYMECLKELVSTIQPQYSIITSSDEKKENNETVRLLEEEGAKVLLTREGAITVVSDGNILSIEQ